MPRATPFFTTGLLCRMLAASVILTVPMVRAQSFSDPLSGALGSSLYSESSQTGPSSSIAPGSTDFRTPYLRTGILDPLGFLIESSDLSPYNGTSPYTTPYTNVYSQPFNDPLGAVRAGAYRGNNRMVSGAGMSGGIAARLAFAGSGFRGSGSGRVGGATGSSFAGQGAISSFSAGSSMARGAFGSGTASGFVDPNALVTALTASPSARATPGATGNSDPSSAYISNASEAMGGVGLPVSLATDSQLGAAPIAGTLLTDGSSRSAGDGSDLPTGPVPGGLFPVPASSGGTGYGFQDSTTGTAGQAHAGDAVNASPLLSSRSNGSSATFPSISSGAPAFLHPILTVGSPATRRSPALSVQEVARKARRKAMINNPGGPLPSSFQTRRLERNYLRQKSGASRRNNRYTTAPGSPQ